MTNQTTNKDVKQTTTEKESTMTTQDTKKTNTTSKTDKSTWTKIKESFKSLGKKLKNAIVWCLDKLDGSLLFLGLDPNNRWAKKQQDFMSYFATYKGLPLWKKCTKFLVDSIFYVAYQAHALLGAMTCFVAWFFFL